MEEIQVVSGCGFQFMVRKIRRETNKNQSPKFEEH